MIPEKPTLSKAEMNDKQNRAHFSPVVFKCMGAVKARRTLVLNWEWLQKATRKPPLITPWQPGSACLGIYLTAGHYYTVTGSASPETSKIPVGSGNIWEGKSVPLLPSPLELDLLSYLIQHEYCLIWHGNYNCIYVSSTQCWLQCEIIPFLVEKEWHRLENSSC